MPGLREGRGKEVAMAIKAYVRESCDRTGMYLDYSGCRNLHIINCIDQTHTQTHINKIGKI